MQNTSLITTFKRPRQNTIACVTMLFIVNHYVVVRLAGSATSCTVDSVFFLGVNKFRTIRVIIAAY